MAESRDYDELLFAWKGWRDAAGKVLRQDYEKYVELANTAARLNGMTLKNNSWDSPWSQLLERYKKVGSGEQERAVWEFQLSYRELDEKTDTTFMSVG